MIGGSRTLGRRGKPPAPDGSPSRHRGRTDGLRPPPRRVENGKIVSSPCGPGHGKIPSYPRRKYSPSDPGHGKISFRVFPGLSKILLRARQVFLRLFFSLACTCVRPLSVDPRDSNVSTVTDYVAPTLFWFSPTPATLMLVSRSHHCRGGTTHDNPTNHHLRHPQPGAARPL